MIGEITNANESTKKVIEVHFAVTDERWNAAFMFWSREQRFYLRTLRSSDQFCCFTFMLNNCAVRFNAAN